MSLKSEIGEQPAVIERALAGGAPLIADIVGDRRIEACSHVVFAARGTSDNAARYAKYVWGARNGWTVSLAAPSLFGAYASPPSLDGALVVAASQSGRSPDLIEVVAEAGRQQRPTIVLTNDPASPLAEGADHVLPLEAGPEKAVAATKTYTAELALIAQLSCAWSRSGSADLHALSDSVDAALEARPPDAMMDFLAAAERVAVVGRGFNHATAFEVSLKLQELAQLVAHPYSSADFRHGPLALVEPGFPMIILAAAGPLLADVMDLQRTVVDLGAEVVLFTNDPAHAAGRTILYPPTSEWLSPIPAIVSAQMAIHHITELRGLDPDAPRTITKVTETR